MYNSQLTAQRIKLIAQERNISVSQLLQNCKLGKNTVAKMAGGTDILTQNMVKIGDDLECSVDYLLGRTELKSLPKTADESEMIENYLQLNSEDKKEIAQMVRKKLDEQNK